MEEIIKLIGLGEFFMLIVLFCLIIGIFLIYIIKTIPEKKNKKNVKFLFILLTLMILISTLFIYNSLSNFQENILLKLILSGCLVILTFFVLKVGLNFPKIKNKKIFLIFFIIIFLFNIIALECSVWLDNLSLYIAVDFSLFLLVFFVYFFYLSYFIFLEDSSEKIMVVSFKKRKRNGK